MWTLVVSSSAANVGAERRFDPSMTVRDLKEKLWPIVGTAPAHQQLQVGGRLLTEADDCLALHAVPGFADRAHVNVIDTDPFKNVAALQASNQSVEKYRMDDETYSQRKDTFRKFKESLRADEGSVLSRNEAQRAQERERQEAISKDLQVSSRCQLHGLRGSIEYVGPMMGRTGPWVGVKLDEPASSATLKATDGSVAGHRYFDAQPGYGVFVRPDEVEQGNFPVKDLFDDDEDEEI
ncbi:CAP-Gly domain-containing protein [Plasmodiophora brassicae]|uniref:CAP-Gly domain-containing protein n=1 Tax=Plasmodiophora brassicae TaxID=37360 RepID=A0A0G4J766_PLABS|nr:hypothetical protein PBRA_003190 [Plasmodiophora brassicae]